MTFLEWLSIVMIYTNLTGQTNIRLPLVVLPALISWAIKAIRKELYHDRMDRFVAFIKERHDADESGEN